MGQAQRIKGLDHRYNRSDIRSFRRWHDKLRTFSKRYHINYVSTSTLLLLLEAYFDTGLSVSAYYILKNEEQYISPAGSKAVRNRMLLLEKKGLVDIVVKNRTRYYLPSSLLLNEMFTKNELIEYKNAS